MSNLSRPEGATSRVGPTLRIEIDLAKRPDCFLIGFVEDVAQLVLVIPMSLTPPAIGERRTLNLILPSGGAVSGTCEVRHHRRDPSVTGGAATGCGVAFVAIGPAQRQVLEAFVRAATARSRVSLSPASRAAVEPRRAHARIPAQIDVQIERPKPPRPPPPRKPAAPSSREVLELPSEDVVFEQPAPEPAVATRGALDADVTFESEHNFYSGFSENIGDGGVFVQSWGAHAVGDRLALKVTLPDDEDAPMELVGEVRWSRAYDAANDTPPGFGLAFVDLPPRARTRIESFVKQRQPLFYDD
ncbi:MAG: TIGR02266 family protein [Deltaproteobacteria bacterium]|nr:TIGR02266 family protein [Deltaproteobacteria bacterium]